MSFDISIKNTLLEPKHYMAMGKSVWLYLLLLDKVTVIDESGSGRVLGGKPLTFETDIHPIFPVTRQTYYKWIEQLEAYPYIQTIRTPRGISFRVLKAHKYFGVRRKENLTSYGKGSNINLTSGVNKTLHQRKQNLTSNIRQYKDNTKTKDEYEKERKKAAQVRELLEAKGIVTRKAPDETKGLTDVLTNRD